MAKDRSKRFALRAVLLCEWRSDTIFSTFNPTEADKCLLAFGESHVHLLFNLLDVSNQIKFYQIKILI